MAQKTRTREINIVDKGGTFNTFFRKLTGDEHEYDFEGLEMLRKLLSNERARVLHTIKYQNPRSLYELAKYLKRDFKSVSDDIKLLERFGFVEMVSERTGKRERLHPTLVVERLIINIKI
ncbi:winged helix DNA-binding protein [Candidatus Pacearchaeota archaeon]|nr:winged helix DNA-binding protein [Candidatus Pacearchaeota archaeon]